MKNKFTSFKYFLLPLMAGLSFQAQSALIGFNPSVALVDVGENVEVDLTISGLGGSGPSSFISGFDLDISFDDSILAYSGFEFGTGLDDVAGWGINSLQFETDFGGGLVNVFEVSFDWDADLDFFQPDEFVLGTFTFTGLSEGSSALNAAAPFFGVGLSGGFDNFFATEVPMEVSAGLVRVPEPGVALLFATGLLGFGIQRKLKKRT